MVGAEKSVYAKLWNEYVMIAKIKIKTSLSKAGLPRDEGYIRYSTFVLLRSNPRLKNMMRKLNVLLHA